MAGRGAACGHNGYTLGRFEKWAALMGGILEVAGIPSFLEGRERLHAQADAETEDWTAFVTAWYGACGGASVVAKDLLRLAVDNDLLIDLRAGRNQLAAQQRLGHALRGRVDRVFACWRIRKSGEGATGNTAYRLQLMGDKTPETPKTPSATHETALEVGGVLAHSGGVLPASSPKTPPVNGHAAGTNPGVSGVFGVSDRLDTTFVDGLSS